MNSTKKLTIAVIGARFLSWNGGIDFLRHQLNALSHIGDKANIILVFPKNKELNFFNKLILRAKILLKKILGKNYQSALNKLTNPALSSRQIANLFDYLDKNIKMVFISHNPKKINQKLKDLGVDVTLFADHKLICQIPNASYYPDLQHKYLTNFFNAEEIAARDQVISDLITNSKVLIVNSFDVLEDLKKFFPSESKNCQIMNLPYSPMLMELKWLDDLDIDVIKKYNLPKRYFLISNQLWIHKSHITAFEALAQLIKENPEFSDVKIICTGPMHDYRFPKHLDNLKERIKELGISDKIEFLGLIPKREQIEIMKKSVAVIQPTLFEGDPGGGSFYDAVSLGVPAILSDIKVNLEASGEYNAFFFKAKDVHDLMDKMKNILQNSPIRRQKSDLIEISKNRSIKLGNRLLEIANKAIELTKSTNSR